jgi:hypothetical protein
MIRRLDESSSEVAEHLTNGPLTSDERHTLAASLMGLLSVVAESLQDQKDGEAADAIAALNEFRRRWGPYPASAKGAGALTG